MFVFTDTVSVLVFVLDFAVKLLQGKLSVGRCTLCLIVSLRTLRPAVRTVVAVCESAAISTVKPLMKDHPDKRPPYEKSAS